MTKLVISLASRGRPQQLLETIARSMANWTHENTVMMVQLDADDTAALQMLHASAPHAWFVGPNGPRVISTCGYAKIPSRQNGTVP